MIRMLCTIPRSTIAGILCGGAEATTCTSRSLSLPGVDVPVLHLSIALIVLVIMHRRFNHGGRGGFDLFEYVAQNSSVRLGVADST